MRTGGISLLLLIATMLFIGVITEEYPDTATPQQTVSALEIHDLVNHERVKKGLQPLTLDSRLEKSAIAKCKHMADNAYWSHDAPDGTTWQSFIKAQIPANYQMAGENQAQKYNESRKLVEGWMNSPAHRENIVNIKFSKVGYGSCFAGLYEEPYVLVVQHLLQ